MSKLLNVKLKKNGWSNKFQYWSLGYKKTTDFSIYCPHFWISIFCILITPYTLLKKLYEPISKYFKAVKVAKFLKFVQSLSDEKICTLYSSEQCDTKYKGYAIGTIFDLWWKLKGETLSNDEIQKIFDKYTKTSHKFNKPTQTDTQIDKPNSLWWIYVVKYTKLITTNILVLIIMFIFSGIINALIMNWDFSTIVFNLKQLGQGILFLAIVFGLGMLVYLFLSKFLTMFEYKYTKKFLSYIGGIFVSIYKGISIFISMMYSNLCPGIIWLDDDGNEIKE